MLSNLFGGNAGASSSQQQGETTSLLADWNSYSKQPDVESGQRGASATDTLFQSVDKASSSVGNFLQNSFTNVRQAASNVGTSVQTTIQTGGEAFSIPSGQQLTQFFGFLAGGAVMLILAFMLFLPVIIITPSKFALSFTFGCLLVFIGFAQLRGWKQQMQYMLSAERLPFSAAYMGSILATLYAALFMHSYVLSLVCSGLQVVALLYYVMSYFPGGTQGVKFMLNLFWQAVLSCFGGVQRLVMNHSTAASTSSSEMQQGRHAAQKHHAEAPSRVCRGGVLVG